jgi:adenosylcobinamide-phosphate synthase
MAYKAINTMDSMVGYKNERYICFGRVSARLDDIANYIPARLTGLLLVGASFLWRFDYKKSFRVMRRDCRKHSSPNSGYPEAAVAGALNVQLGGTNSYFGKPVAKPFIGDPERPLAGEDINSAVKLMYTAAVLALAFFSAAALVWRNVQ